MRKSKAVTSDPSIQELASIACDEFLNNLKKIHQFTIGGFICCAHVMFVEIGEELHRHVDEEEEEEEKEEEEKEEEEKEEEEEE